MDIISRKQAKEQHLTFYFTGQPCKHGHVSKRNTKDGSCYECCRLRSIKFRENDPSYHSKTYHKSKQQRQSYNAQWYANNRARVLAYCSDYYSNPEKLTKHLETCARWRAKNNEDERRKKAEHFAAIAPTWELGSTPTERDFKYWLGGELISRGYTVFNEQYIDEERTSRIDLLVPELLLGVECKLTSHNWSARAVNEQQQRYEKILASQGYTVFVVSLDGSLGVSATDFLQLIP